MSVFVLKFILNVQVIKVSYVLKYDVNPFTNKKIMTNVSVFDNLICTVNVI